MLYQLSNKWHEASLILAANYNINNHSFSEKMKRREHDHEKLTSYCFVANFYIHP